MSTEAASSSSLSLMLSAFLTPTTLILTFVTLVALAVYYVLQGKGKNWEDYGVKQAKLSPVYFFGGDFKAKFSNILNEYGDTVGFKMGSNMGLITVDLKLLRHVLTKDFNNFVDRRETLRTTSPFGKSLFFAKGTDWRRQRQILSPTFSTGKLRQISKLVDQSARNLTTYFEESARNGRLVPIKDMTSRYTCEVIAKTAFGLDANFIEEKDAEFLEYARNILILFSGARQLVFQVLDRFPGLINFLLHYVPFTSYLDPFNRDSNKYFKSILASTVSERRQQRQNGVSKRSYMDFLELVLKANEDAEAGRLEKGDNGDEQIFENVALKGFTDEELLGHSVLIIFAGMETTATTLQMCLYELAANQEIQEKLYHEIQDVVEYDTPTAEELNQLYYTEQVINEALRKYPPAPILNRKAKETKTYDGITIPKDAFVILPYYYIMNDPRIYPDPDKFDPERFSPAEREKRDPLTFLPFGQGPRQCLGMRLAYLELKMALAHIMRKVKVVVNDKTEPKKGVAVKIKPAGLVTPTNPIELMFELRN